ncbi:hypothetical protein S2M10_13670 [Sphingomonas sp. S2M10]|uniref:hypothetical protein n=1 Tax=Sphingomonas sp. S2M10 TaxID=2705010 RepID=UPI0014576812|nr:hypothetical protein [Sphingomonas sp. S2M10]NLS26384.1 hypothetical protein [Sphingomonas sp. S2M10]
MRSLDEQVALALVEQGSRLAPLDQAVLLVATLDGLSTAEAAALAVDRRDRLLLDARMTTFGRDIGFFARCPQCGEGNEAAFDLAMLPDAAPAEGVAVQVGSREIRLRAPSSAAIARAVLAARTEGLLAEIAGDAVAIDDPDLARAVEELLPAAFPLLDIRFTLTCSGCETVFDTRFDIVPWLWREIEGVAAHAIDTVDRLARAYGWTEREILALSPARRRLYLAKLVS